MRVLWFTNTPCNYPSGYNGGYNGGGWLSSLESELVKRNDVELGICFCQNCQAFKVEQNGVSYYPVPRHRKKLSDKIIDIFRYKNVRRDEILWEHYKDVFKRAIDDFKPDVIEIFGSELYMGLATFVAPCPVVLHIQGLLSLSIYIWFPSGVSKQSYLLQDWNPKRIYDRFQLYVYWRRSCYREQEVLRQTKHVIGRTHWDELATKILNPERVYHYGGEILRKEFYEEHKRVIPDKLTIVTTTSSAIYKGFDYVLQTANILKNVMHLDFEWMVYGNVNPTFQQKFTGLQYQNLNIRLMGVASAATLCKAISRATVYFQPSYIENSPNSVCEAQILGVPVVATNVGGTPSLIEDGVTGFLVPTNDPYTAAYRINQLNNYMDFNLLMGKKAKVTGVKRHNPKQIVDELMATYQQVIFSNE